MKETKNVSEGSVAYNFSKLILDSFTGNELECIRLAYFLEETGVIDDDLNIHVPFDDKGVDLELLEKAVRFLLRETFRSELLKRIEFRVVNCPEGLREYIVWFIKFFAYLESEELYKSGKYLISETFLFPPEVFSSKFIPYKFEIENRHCLHEEISVEFF